MSDVVTGLSGPIEISRDAYGVPHVTATDADDAWLGMGLVCAQDRMFQIDYDRRRATGRWAEVAGRDGVRSDILARRLGLAEAAQADLAVMAPPLQSAMAAYARGVNLVLASGWRPLEAEEIGYELEAWEPWHSVAAFKVRHVMMGLWQHKLAQAMVLAQAGPDALAGFDIRPLLGATTAVPPDGRLTTLLSDALDDVTQAAPYLGFLAEVEPGSNAWAVSGARTAHGGAVICNDSHRALDAPNVYWQCRVSCPDFDVTGGAFPGLPAFPHFGYNGKVAWAITHATADTQDLYLEQFDPNRPGWYRTPDGWLEADRWQEHIEVRGGPPVSVERWRTRHGPVVHGDPRHGVALTLKCTITDQARAGLDPLLPMLTAASVKELVDTQAEWVDPVNNLVAADSDGHIAYHLRGLLPLRSSSRHRRLPVPGWDGGCEWVGSVAFEQLPGTIDPSVGYVMTANNAVVDGDEPYISFSFADPFRAERLRQHLDCAGRPTVTELASWQADTLSWAAVAWTRRLRQHAPYGDGQEPAELARQLLADWDGDLVADSAPALLYGCFRRALVEQLYRPLVGERLWEWMTSGSMPATHTLIQRSLARDTWEFLGAPVPPADRGGPRAGHGPSEDAIATALKDAWQDASVMAGDDPARWRWGDHHQAVPLHPLQRQMGSRRMHAPPVGMGGDADTVQAAHYGWRRRTPFTVTGLSVYRQVVDLADPATASYVIPGGSSGDPRDPHFDDQWVVWAEHRRLPMSSDYTSHSQDGVPNIVSSPPLGGGAPNPLDYSSDLSASP
jgi:penicillin G amidase